MTKEKGGGAQWPRGLWVGRREFGEAGVSMPSWIDVRWVKGVYGGSGGGQRLTEKAERLLKLMERMSTGGRGGGESRASPMSGWAGESVRERR